MRAQIYKLKKQFFNYNSLKFNIINIYFYQKSFLMNFSNRLLLWYDKNKRHLPWRETHNPYAIWLSEIMLQQTRVAQGLPYYLKFIESFPTVFDLANADEEKVLKLWQGLGYYSRARNLHQTAQKIAFKYDGNFPNNYKELLKLKGVGEYTAAAIASISFDEAVPVVDGNVFRVLARYFAIETDILSAKAKNEFTNLAFELLDKKNPAQFNQAIMEFGALQCVPANPDCENCIFNTDCQAFLLNRVAEFPVKIKKTKIKNRFLHYMVLRDLKNKTLANKRTGNGIWKNLYEFPVLETNEEVTFSVISQQIKEQFTNVKDVALFNQDKILHKLSHQHLHIWFYDVELNEVLPNGMDISEVSKLPTPIVIHNFLEQYFK